MCERCVEAAVAILKDDDRVGRARQEAMEYLTKLEKERMASPLFKSWAGIWGDALMERLSSIGKQTLTGKMAPKDATEYTNSEVAHMLYEALWLGAFVGHIEHPSNLTLIQEVDSLPPGHLEPEAEEPPPGFYI
jgi:hypothetical protein